MLLPSLKAKVILEVKPIDFASTNLVMEKKSSHSILSTSHFLSFLQQIFFKAYREKIKTRDLIHNEDKSPESEKRRLVSAVITQLFSYMVKNGVQYGYVNTGERMIFLWISAQIEYHVWNPRDYDFDQPAFLHNTAIAEVVAFSLQALVANSPGLGLHDAVAKLTTWPVEREDVLKDIPTTDEKDRAKPETPGFIPDQPNTLDYRRPPIKLRARRTAKRIATKKKNHKEDETESSNL